MSVQQASQVGLTRDGSLVHEQLSGCRAKEESMRRNLGLVIIRGLLATVVVASMFAASSDAAPGSRDSLAPTLRKEMKNLVTAGVPGVVVLVRRDGRTVRLASGYSNLAKKTPMHVGDRFRIGSVTKSFVATVLLQLAGEGKLSLEDSIDRWLPGVVPKGEDITIRHLLGHRSGLFDYLADEKVLQPYLSGNFGYVWTPQQLIAVATSHAPPFEPGAKFSYSNTNYILLGLIVEAASGNSVGSELRQRIFKPLGLRSTFLATSQRIPGAHAHGYLVSGNDPLQDVTLVSPSYVWTAGGIVSTASDVADFYRALLRGRLLKPALLREMETASVGYGLGLAKTRLPCGDIFGHNGALASYLTYAFNSKDGKRQFVVLANSLTVDDQVGSKQAQRTFQRLLQTAACGA
jgi:D-alanyl-D-alanine carboxypeptidase